MSTGSPAEILPLEVVQGLIHLIRGQKVMLDNDLAALYGVPTRVLNQAVSRQVERFPDDFRFQLTKTEFEILKSQFVTSSWGGRRKLPYAFTEQGVAMLSSVLNSPRAVQVNIEIMRAFVRLRELAATHRELAQRLADLESKYDDQFKIVFDAIRQLMIQPEPPQRKIGFRTRERRKAYGEPKTPVR